MKDHWWQLGRRVPADNERVAASTCARATR